MKLTGPACTEALSEAEEAGRRERRKGKAGGVRVERRVRRVRPGPADGVSCKAKLEVHFLPVSTHNPNVFGSSSD